MGYNAASSRVLVSGSWNGPVQNTERGSRFRALAFLHRVAERIFPGFETNDFYAEADVVWFVLIGWWCLREEQVSGGVPREYIIFYQKA